jgi:hypothetical protein
MTPLPPLTIEGTTEPPSGQHGPDSGIRSHTPAPTPDESTEAATEAAAALSATTEAPNRAALYCAEPGCPKSLPIVTGHLDNLEASGWRCFTHKDGRAA